MAASNIPDGWSMISGVWNTDMQLTTGPLGIQAITSNGKIAGPWIPLSKNIIIGATTPSYAAQAIGTFNTDLASTYSTINFVTYNQAKTSSVNTYNLAPSSSAVASSLPTILSTEFAVGNTEYWGRFEIVLIANDVLNSANCCRIPSSLGLTINTTSIPTGSTPTTLSSFTQVYGTDISFYGGYPAINKAGRYLFHASIQLSGTVVAATLIKMQFAYSSSGSTWTTIGPLVQAYAAVAGSQTDTKQITYLADVPKIQLAIGASSYPPIYSLQVQHNAAGSLSTMSPSSLEICYLGPV